MTSGCRCAGEVVSRKRQVEPTHLVAHEVEIRDRRDRKTVNKLDNVDRKIVFCRWNMFATSEKGPFICFTSEPPAQTTVCWQVPIERPRSRVLLQFTTFTYQSYCYHYGDAVDEALSDVFGDLLRADAHIFGLGEHPKGYIIHLCREMYLFMCIYIMGINDKSRFETTCKESSIFRMTAKSIPSSLIQTSYRIQESIRRKISSSSFCGLSWL